MRIFAAVVLLLTLFLISVPVFPEESETVAVLHVEGTAYFIKERNNTVLILEPGERLSYGDKIIILDNSSISLRDNEGNEVEVAENTQAEIGELFGITAQKTAEFTYAVIAILVTLIIVLLWLLFFKKKGIKTDPTEKEPQNKNHIMPVDRFSNTEDIYKDDIELRFDESDQELIFEVIKGGVIPSYSTLRLDEKRVKCLLNKLNEVNEKWFEAKKE